MTVTFEEAHPLTAQVIEERGYCTSRYERYYDGRLQEVWEKIDGVWTDISEKELTKLRNEEKLAKVRRELALIRRRIERQLKGERV